MPEKDLTPAEVADLIGASEGWVREQARRRRVPHQRLDRGRVMFTAAQVEEIRKLREVPVLREADEDPALLGTTSRSRARHRLSA